VFSEIVGAQLVARGDAAGRGATGRIPLAPPHEHVLFASAGSAEVEGTALRTGQLLYLGTGREQVAVTAAAGSTIFLLPARRGAAGRAAADVVELRGPEPGRDYGRS
jgi:redox-sensitive bicupin YhaK (pirin superfamily)